MSGLTAWKRATNHNRMLAFAARAGERPPGPVRIAFFGSSAFRITTPMGITVMVDPWRNHPSRRWDWYFRDFPKTEVDIGLSTHAHFDHDALHRLDASVLLDRLIGDYAFADLAVTGIPDKHATDASEALYDFREIILRHDGVDITPPDNPRSWDNCLLLIETGGLRILHWGDNRADIDESVRARLGRVDILLLPVDDSRHVLGHKAVADIVARLEPRVVIPHHYFIMDVTQRQSTLLPHQDWLAAQERVRRHDGPEASYAPGDLPDATEVHSFDDHVAFDAAAWRRG